ncbi:hypothetical protein MITS9508_00353 [Synechococcus sp. MIT S9508]|nr:hypothetical protein MITS9508_00353 [Synechococcus sp. MIT S9508]
MPGGQSALFMARRDMRAEDTVSLLFQLNALGGLLLKLFGERSTGPFYCLNGLEAWCIDWFIDVNECC